MPIPLFSSRRNFLKTTLAAVGAVALNAPLASTAKAETTPLQGSKSLLAEVPVNKMSAVLPPINHAINLRALHHVREVMPGVNAELWTFEESAPGPILHVKEGEQVNFTLDNTAGVMLHSIDFHAALLPWDKYYQSVPMGEKLSFSFTPKYPGVFMYHCGTPPVLLHLGNGMHGAIVVEPKDGWPEKADHEYVLVQHEYYLTDPNDQNVRLGDFSKMLQGKPDYVVFNGYFNQYADEPLTANPGELIRMYICNAGPTTFSAFHVIGTLFTATYADGNPANKQMGMQTVTIPPGGGYVVEMRIPDEGLYPFVTHSFAYTGLGALGLIKVGNPPPMAGGAQH